MCLPSPCGPANSDFLGVFGQRVEVGSTSPDVQAGADEVTDEQIVRKHVDSLIVSFNPLQ